MLPFVHVPMLVVTRWYQGSVPGNPMFSDCQLPVMPAASMQLVLPVKLRSVCCFGTGISGQRHAVPSACNEPFDTRSSTMHMKGAGPFVLRTASATIGPLGAGWFIGTNICAVVCGATIAYERPGW